MCECINIGYTLYMRINLCKCQNNAEIARYMQYTKNVLNVPKICSLSKQCPPCRKGIIIKITMS